MAVLLNAKLICTTTPRHIQVREYHGQGPQGHTSITLWYRPSCILDLTAVAYPELSKVMATAFSARNQPSVFV